jgi:hypothetical protein
MNGITILAIILPTALVISWLCVRGLGLGVRQ